jgi:predicted  nucleic acid-binding Zn-ribbon protein
VAYNSLFFSQSDRRGLSGGKKDNIDGLGGTKEQLRSALDFLQESSFDEVQQDALAQQIRQLKQDLITQERQYQKMRKQRQVDETRLPEMHQEIQSIQQKLADAHTAKEQLGRRAVSLASYEHLPELAYRRLQSQFNTVRLELPEEALPWWKSLICWLLGRTERQVLAKMLHRCQSAINQTLGTTFEIKPPIDRRALLKQTQRLEEGLDRLQELKTVQANFKQRSQEITEFDRRYKERQKEVNEIERRLALPLRDFYHMFHVEYHEQHCALFDLSRQFLVQETLKRKKDVKDALDKYQKVIPDKANLSETSIPDLFKTLSLMFPVITCTLHSVRNMLPWVKECVDRVIIDESGMIPLHYTFPLLVRSRKAIVVGDPLQIEPIIDQSQQTLDRAYPGVGGVLLFEERLT